MHTVKISIPNITPGRITFTYTVMHFLLLCDKKFRLTMTIFSPTK